MRDPVELLAPVLALHDGIRAEVVAAAERQSLQSLSAVHRDEEGDTIYALDAVSERLITRFTDQLARQQPFILIAEGLEGGAQAFPRGTPETEVPWRIILDPIDGTRGLMYQKRSAWILTGIAPNLGASTSLLDVVLSVQTEIPLPKQHLSDQVWAVKDGAVTARRYNRLTGESAAIRLAPSAATTIAHGFASVARFFPGAREELAAIDEEIVLGALGPARAGKAHCFEDQYASTGGQLYELMAGHDRFIADLRPLAGKGGTRGSGLCCHPYDICAALAATALGVVLTDPWGRPLDPPLDLTSDVAWVGYANHAIRAQIEPLLQEALKKRGWNSGVRS